MLEILFHCNAKCTTLNTQIKASNNINANIERCTINIVACEHCEEFLHIKMHKRQEGGSQIIFMLLNNKAVQAVFLGENKKDSHLWKHHTPSAKAVFISIHDHFDVLVRFAEVTEVSMLLFVEVFGDPVCARVASIFL